jgi:hypothetical protein
VILVVVRFTAEPKRLGIRGKSGKAASSAYPGGIIPEAMQHSFRKRQVVCSIHTAGTIFLKVGLGLCLKREGDRRVSSPQLYC